MAGTIVAATTAHRARGVVKQVIAITCDAAGDASITVTGIGFGRLVAVGYKPGTLATGVDLTVTEAESGANILTLTNAGLTARYFRPSNDPTTVAGVAITDGANSPDSNRDIWVGGKIKVTAAQGGNLGAGELHLVIDEADLKEPRY